MSICRYVELSRVENQVSNISFIVYRSSFIVHRLSFIVHRLSFLVFFDLFFVVLFEFTDREIKGIGNFLSVRIFF